MHAIAENLRRLRKAADLTQAELARRADIARATLAAMEQPDANPGIVAVQAVAKALGVGVDELVEPRPASRIVRVTPEDISEFRSADGLFVARMVSPVTATGIQIQQVTMYPGCRTVGRPHPAGTQEFFLVQAGTAELTVGDEVETLETGSLIQFPGHLHHIYANATEQRVEAVSMVAAGF